MDKPTSFTLHINCGNAAFDGNYTAELSRILREYADRLELGIPPASLRDANGNRVGTAEFHTA